MLDYEWITEIGDCFCDWLDSPFKCSRCPFVLTPECECVTTDHCCDCAIDRSSLAYIFTNTSRSPFFFGRNSSSYICLRQGIGDFLSDSEWITEFQQSFCDWLSPGLNVASAANVFVLDYLTSWNHPDLITIAALLGSFRVYCVIAAIFSLRFFCLLVLCVILSKS